MLLLMEGGFSSVEMRVLKGRMKDGYDQAFREGRFLGGTPPPPYVYDPVVRKPVVDQDQLSRLQQIWILAETMSAQAIAQQMRMPEIAVRRAISDERLLWYQALRVNPSTGEHIACEWEPCMDAAQAAAVASGRRTRIKGGTRRAYAALLSNLGLLRCGYCGSTAKTWQNSRVKKDGTRNDYYGCQTKNVKNKCEKARLIPQELLHEKVLTNLFNTLADLEYYKSLWLQWQTSENTGGELEDLVRKEQAERTKKSRLVAAISEGVLDFADAKNKMAEINATLERLEGERRALSSLQEQTMDWSLLAIDRETFESLTPDSQRAFLQLAIDQITIYENYAIITYPFPRTADFSRDARIQFPPRKAGYIRP
jgi:site-specific DNA recombinase